MRRRLTVLFILAVTAAVAGCGHSPRDSTLSAVGIESQYADVIAQVAGPRVRVRAIETDPNTDPHAFEASPAIAHSLATASLVVENGLGYDPWVDRILAASPGARTVIDVGRLLGLPATANPHVWYDPKTMPAVAEAVAAALSAARPSDAAYFQSRARAFVASLAPWQEAIERFKRRYGGTAVAVTEPVADDLLEAAGCTILSPYPLQIAIMNGTDPAPQDVAAQEALLSEHKVKVLLYNRQVTNPLTASFVDLARRNGIPVVGVYETMPVGYHYRSWMLAETSALEQAVSHGISTTQLGTGTLRP